ncbi:MAG TPA: ABC transporter permease [Dongiaceae bacterium]|nr:ABC transporter permease [Dongiaceae bacterium]
MRTRIGDGTSRAGRIAAILLAAAALVALAAPWLAPGDPMAMTATPLTPPFTDTGLPLGSDQLGRDLLGELIHGARVSLAIGAIAALSALLIGIVIGTLAGFIGGWCDEILMRITEAFQTIPSFLLALALVSLIGPSTASVILAIAITSWPASARLTRGEILSLRQRDFVAGCRLIGMHPLRIAFTQVLPNALAPVIALIGVLMASAILIESALAFLGLGDPNQISWGSMVANGRALLRAAPYIVIVPGVAIAATVLCVTLVGDWLASHLNRLRGPA